MAAVKTPSYWESRLSESEKVREYEALKRRWVSEHPNATPKEYEAAIREIAERIRF